MTFRNATHDDLPGIVAIYNSTVPGRMVTADTTPVSVESKRKWFDEHSPSRRPIWVVENGSSEMVGWVSLQSFSERPAYDPTAEISIYLDEKYRGAGLGRKVLDESIERCRAIGIKSLLGKIFEHNEPSIRLFRKAGFEQWGLLPNVTVLDGIERSVVILGMRINK
jgi:phosphinothricin acetyltransferase